jgi:hypothetical protein
MRSSLQSLAITVQPQEKGQEILFFSLSLLISVTAASSNASFFHYLGQICQLEGSKSRAKASLQQSTKNTCSPILSSLLSC